MRTSLRLLLTGWLLALGACSTVDPAQQTADGVFRTSLIQEADFGARGPRPDAASAGARSDSGEPQASSLATAFAPAAETERSAPRLQVVTDRTAQDGSAAGGARYRVNFEDADIRSVIQAILGEALRMNYVVAADVAGKVTISSPRTMTAEELFSALETMLQSSGFTMTRSGATVRIAAGGPGGGVVDASGRASPGYGLSVVPLRHVSANVMSQLVSGFVVEADGLKVDAARNAMVVRGPSDRRQQAVEAIMSFDADWMQDQAVGIYEVRRATPEAIVNELNRVFDADQKGAAAGTVQFKAIARLRAVMVVARSSALMRRAETWIRRLDRDTPDGDENVFVYKARYRDAKELARIIKSLFQAGGDAGRGAAATTDPRARQGTSGFETGAGQDGDGGLTSDGRSGTGSSSSPTGAVANASASGSPQATPVAATGTAPGESAAEGSGGEFLDLTRQNGTGQPKILVSADAANNAVVTYADGYTYQKILAALRQLDSTPLQVAIHVTIAEVRLTDELKNGVEYFVKSRNLGLGRDNGSASLFGMAADTLAKSAPGFNLLFGTNSSPDIVISALDRVTNVEILSSPSLVVAENQPANFQVGDEIPIVTRQAQSVDTVDAPLVNQVEFKNTGVILNVTPRIGQNDAVTMQIDQEISSVSSGSNTLTPTISKRRVASNISVVSGQTVLLAGLISKRDERGKNGIPILGELKGIGDLFSQRNSAKDRTELVVFIRPKVIRSGDDAQTVAEEFRSRLTAMGGARRPQYTK